MKGDLIYSLNFVADVREETGDAWSQNTCGISGTKESKSPGHDVEDAPKA